MSHEVRNPLVAIKTFATPEKVFRIGNAAGESFQDPYTLNATLKTGDTDGDKLMAALKGLEWESPRGKMSIDANTRDVVQDVYIRRVERKDGELYNVEFDVVRQVKDPYRK